MPRQPHGRDKAMNDAIDKGNAVGKWKRAAAVLLTGAVMAGSAAASGELAGRAPFLGAPAGQQSDVSTPPYTQTFAALAADTLVETIRWWGFHGVDSGGAGFDQFVVTLGGVVQTGVLTVEAEGPLSRYTLDIPDALIAASSLSIVNASPDVEWYWQSAIAEGNPLAPSADTVAFSLTGTVGVIDEPATRLLFLAAGAGWCLRRWRASARG
jgi:hypothetical protein